MKYNLNPLTNANNNFCIPFTYRYTNHSDFNFNASSNTEGFSGIDYIYDCTDSTVLNYNPMVNTSNNTYITIVKGYMDKIAYKNNKTIKLCQ